MKKLKLLYRCASNWKTRFEVYVPDDTPLCIGDTFEMGMYGTPTKEDFFDSDLHRYLYDSNHDHNLFEIEDIEKPVKYVCTHCGTDDLNFNAWAKWDVKEQKFALENTYDNAYCNFCEGDTSVAKIHPSESYLDEGWVILYLYEDRFAVTEDYYYQGDKLSYPVLFKDMAETHKFDGEVAYCYRNNLVCLVVDATKSTPLMVFDIKEQKYYTSKDFANAELVEATIQFENSDEEKVVFCTSEYEYVSHLVNDDNIFFYGIDPRVNIGKKIGDYVIIKA